MADIQSNIDINIDTSDAISSIKNLQRQISVFHQSLRSSGSAVNAAISEDLTRNLINSVNATKKFSASIANVQSTTESFTTSLEKNKLSMGQYFRYAMGASGSFSKKFKTEFDTISQVAESRVRTLQTQFIKLGRDANGMTKAIKIRPLSLDMQNYSTQTAIALQKQQLFNQLVKQGSTNLLNFGKNTQWAGRQLMVGFTVPLTMLGSVATKTFMEMEEQIIRLKRVYGDFATTTADTDKMVSQIRALANEFTKYGVAVSDTMGLAADAAAMGKTGSDLLAQVKEANRLAVLGGVDQSQALETTTSITNAFGIAAEDLAGKINFLNAVENQSVTSIEDLTIAIPKAAPVIKQLGGNVEDLAFFLTAMKEGGINASEGANALKSGIASIINPTAKASEFMAGLGVNIKGIVEANKGNVRNMIVGVAQALNQLDPLNRARAIEQMFGKFQFARISTLFQNITKEGTQAQTVLGLTKATSEELAILSEREMKKVSDSPMYKFQKAIEDIKTTLVPLGEAFLKMITPVIEFVKGALENFNKLDGGIKNFIMGTIAVLGALAPAAIMAFGLVANGVANLIKGGNLLRNVFTSVGRGTGLLGTQTQYMSSEQLEAAAAASSLNQSHQTLTQQFTAETAALRRLIAAYNDTIAAQQRLAAAGAIGRSTTGGRGGKKFARGGIISGPGTGRSDSIAAMVSNGEAIIPAEAVKENPGIVHGLINGTLPKFNQGGIVNTLDVGGQTYTLPASMKKEVAEQLRREALRLHSYDPEIAATVMTMVEQSKGSKSTSVLPDFRKNAVMALDLFDGLGVGGAAQIILPPSDGKEMAEANKKFRSDVRGAEGKAEFKTISDMVKAMPEKQKEFDVAKDISKGAYEAAIKMGISEKDAIQKTGYNPNKKNAYGIDRAHIAEGGALKAFKEIWKSSFINLDPRIENGLMSTLSRTPDQKAIVVGAIDDLISSEKNPEVKKSLSSLKDKVSKNQTFTEAERKAFASVASHMVQNDGKYLGGKSFANLKNTLQLLDAGYKNANLNQKYRTTPSNEQVEQNIKNLKADQAKRVDAARSVAVSKGNRYVAPPTTQPGKGMSFFKRALRYARGVVSVPGPKGAGDVVPAMLSPGESVIPAGMSKKYAPLISGMVNGTLPGYEFGLDGNDPFGPSSFGAFDMPKSRGKMGSLLNAGKDLAKGFGSSIIPAGKKFGASIVDRLDDSKVAAKLGSKIFGNDITTKSGSTFRNGVEVRQDKNGNSYYVQEGKGRISKEEAMSNQMSRKEVRAANREQRMAKSGRIAQAGMGLSMALGGLSMVGGPVGEAAAKATGPLSALTAGMSLIPGPAGIAVGAIAGVGVAIMQAQEEFVKFRTEAAAAAKAVSSGTDAMKSLSEFAGTVSPSETMNRIRANESSPYNIKTGKETFGGSYLQSEQGKGLIGAVQKTEILSGKNVAVSDMATQLSQAVATNVLTKEQAASIAYNLGAELKDYDFSANVLGKMTEILGPNGEDLTKEPLEVAARIVAEKQSSLGKADDTGSVKGMISDNKYGLGIVSDMRANATEVAAAEAKYSQGFSDILDMGQQNLDNLELAHRARIDDLTAAGDLLGIEKENNQYLQNRTKLQQDNSKVIQAEYDYINGLENSGQDNLRKSAEQIVDNLENTKEALFAEMDQATKDAAQLAIRNISDNTDLNFADKATLTANITVENIADYQKLQALFPVDGNEETWSKIAKVGIKYGSGAQDQMIKLGGFFGEDEKATYDVFVNYVNDNENGQQIMDDLTEVTRVTRTIEGNPIKMSELIDTKTGAPTQKLKDISAGVKKVSDAITKNKGKAIKYSFETVGFQLTKSQADYFNSLPADQQKVYTTTFLTIEKTVTDDQLKAYRASKVAANAGNSTLENYWSTMSDENLRNNMADEEAIKRTEALTTGDVKTPPPSGDTTGGGSTNPLDDLLKRLKNIRAAAVNASGGIKELMKWMASGALEKKGGGLLFNGIDQQLGKKGYNKDFIDFITSQEKAVQAKYITISKTGVVTLKKEGEALQNLFNALTLGDYERSVAAAVKSSEQELAVRKDLLQTGMSYKDAVEAGKDSGLAEAIAAIKASTNIKDKNKAIAETIALYKKQKAAAEAVKTSEEKFNELSDKVGKKFDADKQKISLDFEISIAGEKAAVTKAQQEIEGVRFKIDDLNAGLTTIGYAEEEINKKYDARKEALDKVRELNDKIAASQKDQLSLASALTSGDMAAAAKAAQDMRANASSRGMDDMSKELDLARQQELDGLAANVNGKKLSRKEIEKQIKDLEKEIFTIEESRLEPAQEAIRKAEALRDTKLTALDNEKIKWDQLKNKIDLANTAAISYAESLKAANGLAAGAIADSKNTSTGTTDYNNNSGGGATGAVGPTAKGTKFGQVSSDKKFIWNGLKWLPVNTSPNVQGLIAGPEKAGTKVGQISSDKKWKWTGKTWAYKATGYSMGGLVNYMSEGGSPFAPMGTDTVPAMLTPGEFVMSRGAVSKYGAGLMDSINNGQLAMPAYKTTESDAVAAVSSAMSNYSNIDNSSVYNSYTINVSGGNNANANDVARLVMGKIKSIDNQRVKGNRIG
jgi:TP901 family phage tail tape measure protein